MRVPLTSVSTVWLSQYGPAKHSTWDQSASVRVLPALGQARKQHEHKDIVSVLLITILG